MDLNGYYVIVSHNFINFNLLQFYTTVFMNEFAC